MKKMEQIDSDLNNMMNYFIQFEQTVNTHLYMSFNNCSFTPQLPSYQVDTQRPTQTFKRRKVSDSDSLVNSQFAEETMVNVSSHIDASCTHASSPSFSSRKVDLVDFSNKCTAFTRVQQKKPYMDGGRKLYKPVPLAPLNNV